MAPGSGEQLQETIARRWQEIEQCFDSETAWRSFSGTLLSLLRQLEDAEGNAAEITNRIAQLFATSPAAHVVPTGDLTPRRNQPKFGGGLNSPWAAERAKNATAQPPPASLSRHTLINVLYGTDRVPLDARDGRARYDNQGATSLSFGAATVSIPDRPIHVKGRLERPRWYRLDFRENPDKHVVIGSLEQLDEAQFVARARTARESDGSKDEALLFIHGYNVGFEDSIRRAAQFAVDLEFPGLAIAYSWPSQNRLFGFAADANVSESSMFKLAEFIGLIRSQLGLTRLHIVAHSMGSRVLARALNQHALTTQTGPGAGAALNQVVFAAPDIDPATFGGFAKVFAKSCERCTLYTSAHDMALTASKWIYRRARAGAAAHALVEYGVEAIDASMIDESMLGHAYFSDNRVLLTDLSDLLSSGRGADNRFGLTAIAVGAHRYWQFDA